MNRIGNSLIGGLVLITLYQSATLQRQVIVPQANSSSPMGAHGAQQAAPISASHKAAGTQILRSGFPHNEDGPWAAICRYFMQKEEPPGRKNGCNKDSKAEEHGIAVDGCETAADFEPSKRIIGHPASCVHGPQSARFLIATVPDPINSQLALDYDRALESIERAPALDGYSFAQYWIPWDEAYEQPQPDVEKLRADDRLRHVREEEPGVLIFYRKDNAERPCEKKQPEILFIFLVGETPSSGINKEEFVRAGEYIHDLKDAFARPRGGQEREKNSTGGCPKPAGNAKKRKSGPPIQAGSAQGCGNASSPNDELLVAGPAFSASIDSLDVFFRAMDHELDQKRIGGYRGREGTWPARVRFLSTVTNAEQINAFKDSEQAGAFKFKQVKRKHISIRFDLLAYDDVAFTNTILNELEGHFSIHSKDIAVLRETASAYEGMPQNKKNQVTAIEFPRGIGPLRNAYQSIQESISSKPQQEYRPVPSLPLSFRQTELHEQEKAPALAKDQTPLSQDAVMRQIARTLEQREIKAVVIYATDSMDTFFLMRYLRQADPDLRIIVPDADLLFARSGDPVDLTGSLVFTISPLFSGEGIFKGTSNVIEPPYERSHLPSSGAEGEFLSVLSLLRPELRFQLSWQSWKDASAIRPAIWMGVLGKTGYWPIREILPDNAEKHATTGGAPNCATFTFATYTPEGPTRSWMVVLGLIALGSIVHSVFIWIGSQKGVLPRSNQDMRQINLRDAWWLEYYALDDDGGSYTDGKRLREVSRRAFYLLVAALIPLAVQIVVLLPTIQFWQYLSLSEKVLTAVLLAASISLNLVAASKIFRQQIARKQTGYIIASTVAILLCAAFVVGWLMLSLEGWPFAQRAIFLNSGVSPVLPLLLMAAVLFFWAITSMRRLTYHGNRNPGMPADAVSHCVLQSDFSSLNTSLDAMLQGVALPGWLGLVVPFGIVAVFLVIGVWDVRGVDVPAYNLTMRALLGLAWAVILTAWARFFWLWLELRKLLRRLERLPIRYAFNRVPSTFSWEPVWHWGGMKRSFLVQTRSLEYLRCIQASDSLTKEVETALQSVLESETSGKSVRASQMKKLSEALSNAGGHLATTVAKLWMQGGTDGKGCSRMKRREYLPSRVDVNSDDFNSLTAEFLALGFLGKIRYVSLQMRNLLTFISFGFIVTLLALESYPFQPKQSIAWSLIALFAVLLGGIIYVFAQMDKDAIVSRLSNTSVGKLGSEFFLRVAGFATLPLLTVLATQIPAISNFLSFWVQPSLSSLH